MQYCTTVSVPQSVSVQPACYDADLYCPFCRIVQGQLEPDDCILAQNDDVMVLSRRRAYEPRGVECLIIPKKHIVNCKTLDASDAYDRDIMNKLVAMAQHLSTRLAQPCDFRVWINNGATAKQTVFHMHMHFASQQPWLRTPNCV